MRAGSVGIGRVYDPPGDDGRARVLVDRLWPRGLRKESARLDHWARDVAPSTALRTWYHDTPRDAAAFAEFRRRYRAELAEPARREAVERLRALAGGAGLVLLTASRDPALGHAAVLAELLLERAHDPADEGGESACLLHRVCLACGRLADEDPPTICPGCGAEVG